MSSFVSLEDVKKIYQMGEVQIMAAAGIDFQIERGEFAVVVGPSGAGKTTVLNILGGMDTASSGRVIVDGKDIAQYSPRQLTAYRRDDIGFVFQFYNLIPNLTALENVELALQICKNPMDAQEVMEDVGKAILKLLQDTCREKGMTVILITHNSAIAPMADRVIKIKNGMVSEMIVNEHPVPVETIEW